MAERYLKPQASKHPHSSSPQVLPYRERVWVEVFPYTRKSEGASCIVSLCDWPVFKKLWTALKCGNGMGRLLFFIGNYST